MLSVTILTRDSAAHLNRLLAAVASFPDIVILDSGSTDDTLAIARRCANVRIFAHDFDGFGAAKNRAADLARHDWILSLDSDEVPTPGLVAEIAALDRDPGCVYALDRRNRFAGRWIRHGGLYPDWTVRLFDRRRTRFNDRRVHESVMTEGLRVVRLAHPLDHDTYDSAADYRAKSARYAELWAAQHADRRTTVLTPALQGAWGFLNAYIVRQGFRDGSDGLLLARLAAEARALRFRRLRERG